MRSGGGSKFGELAAFLNVLYRREGSSTGLDVGMVVSEVEETWIAGTDFRGTAEVCVGVGGSVAMELSTSDGIDGILGKEPEVCQ